MPSLGVTVAIFRAQCILLTKREDFAVWCLPGGAIDAGESLAAAALREVYEETGLVVRLTHLVGVYSLPRWNNGGNHQVTFAAVPVGGALRPAAHEVVEADFFDVHALPADVAWWHREQIVDVVQGVGGSVVRSQGQVWPFERSLTRPELYALRDGSGLSRRAFYARYLDRDDAQPMSLDVAGRVGALLGGGCDGVG